MNSSRPYLLRAIHEWLVDNDLTPYILVNAAMENVHVPESYVDNGKIVLNISPGAVQDLNMDNTAISFNAKFSGQPTNLYIPIEACMAIYSKENGQGMVFNDSKKGDNDPDNAKKKGQVKPNLKIVK